MSDGPERPMVDSVEEITAKAYALMRGSWRNSVPPSHWLDLDEDDREMAVGMVRNVLLWLNVPLPTPQEGSHHFD